MADERQETEIKPGDLVECIYDGDCSKAFHCGGLYRVTKAYFEGSRLRLSFAKDDKGSHTNGWIAENFVLHTPPSQMGYDEYEAILADQDAYEKILTEG